MSWRVGKLSLGGWCAVFVSLVTVVGLGLLVADHLISDGYLSGVDFAAMRETAHMGHLYGFNQASQQLTCEHDGLARIDIVLRGHPGAEVEVMLKEPGATSSTAWVAEIVPTSDGLTRYAVTFPPLDSAGRAYTLTVSATGQPVAERATVEATTVDVYPETTMHLNGRSTPADLAYRAYYRPTTPYQWAALVWGQMSYARVLLNRIAQYKPSLYKGYPLLALFLLTALSMLGLVYLSLDQFSGFTHSVSNPHLVCISALGVAVAVSLIGLVVWVMHPLPATPVSAHRRSTAAEGGPRDADEERVIYDFILALERGEAELHHPPISPLREWVVPSELALRGDWRPAIRLRVPSSVSFDVQLPHDATLRFANALLPGGWGARDVVFSVAVDDGVVFEQPIEPPGASADSSWHEAAVDLSSYGGQRVEITLGVHSEEVQGEKFVAWGLPALVVPGSSLE